MSLMTRLRRRDEDIHAIVQKILPKEPRKIPDCCVDINHPMHWVTCEAVLEDPTHAKKVIPYFRVYLKMVEEQFTAFREHPILFPQKKQKKIHFKRPVSCLV